MFLIHGARQSDGNRVRVSVTKSDASTLVSSAVRIVGSSVIRVVIVVYIEIFGTRLLHPGSLSAKRPFRCKVHIVSIYSRREAGGGTDHQGLWGDSQEGARVSHLRRLTRMGLTPRGITDATGVIRIKCAAIIVLSIVRVGSRGRGLGVCLWGVCGVVVVRVALDLVGHDGRYAADTVLSCVTARLNKVFRRIA